MNVPDTFLKVWDERSNPFCCSIDDLNRIDIAVTDLVYKKVDSIINVILLSGDDYSVLASNIVSWRVVTKAGRIRDNELEQAQKEEDREIRQMLGLPWEE